MKDTSGKWIGWGLGDVDPKVAQIQKWLSVHYAKTAGSLVATGTFDAATAAVVVQLQKNLIAGGRPDITANGVFNYNTQVALGYVKPTPKPRIPFFTVEGHMSDMRHGPVADTATFLEDEGRVAHFPTGYNAGALPFDNASGENELENRVGQFAPPGTKFVVGGFSQGMIVVSDWLIDHVIGTPRENDLLGVLAYGNPCRQTGSVAPWSRAQAGPAANSGMDPKRRIDLLGLSPKFPIMDVYRKGDIFSDNEPGKSGQMKSACYEAIARSDFFGNEFSIAAEIADLFVAPVADVIAIFTAIFSGIGFLANQNNPHYSPFDISGGIGWVRSILPA